jgi:hypothetical protein
MRGIFLLLATSMLSSALLKSSNADIPTIVAPKTPKAWLSKSPDLVEVYKQSKALDEHFILALELVQNVSRNLGSNRKIVNEYQQELAEADSKIKLFTRIVRNQNQLLILLRNS